MSFIGYFIGSIFWCDQWRCRNGLFILLIPALTYVFGAKEAVPIWLASVMGIYLYLFMASQYSL